MPKAHHRHLDGGRRERATGQQDKEAQIHREGKKTHPNQQIHHHDEIRIRKIFQ